MYHHGLGIAIIILLSIIVVLLSLGILTVFSWGLLLVLREFLPMDSKTKKRRKKYKRKKYNNNSEIIDGVETIEETDEETRQDSCSQDTPQTPHYAADESADADCSRNTTEENDRDKDERPSKENAEAYDDLEKMMEFIRTQSKSDCVRLKKKKVDGDKEIETDEVILEKIKNIKDAYLVIYGEKDGKYIVLPYDDDIEEARLVHGGIGDCFELTPKPDRSLDYKIIGVKKPCLASRKGEDYYIEKDDKGELEIKLKNVKQ